MKVKVGQSCLTLCDPMDYTVHGILQARILEWVAFPFSRGSSQPRDQIQVSHIAGRFFNSCLKGSPRILEWVGYPFFSGSSQPRNQTGVSCIAGRLFTNWAIRKWACLNPSHAQSLAGNTHGKCALRSDVIMDPERQHLGHQSTMFPMAGGLISVFPWPPLCSKPEQILSIARSSC